MGGRDGRGLEERSDFLTFIKLTKIFTILLWEGENGAVGVNLRGSSCSDGSPRMMCYWTWFPGRRLLLTHSMSMKEGVKTAIYAFPPRGGRGGGVKKSGKRGRWSSQLQVDLWNFVFFFKYCSIIVLFYTCTVVSVKMKESSIYI